MPMTVPSPKTNKYPISHHGSWMVVMTSNATAADPASPCTMPTTRGRRMLNSPIDVEVDGATAAFPSEVDPEGPEPSRYTALLRLIPAVHPSDEPGSVLAMIRCNMPVRLR